MVPTTADGTPLNELDDFAGSPHAYVKLWRHHAAQPQADRINALAAEREESWLPRYGGLISSEWEFAKGLQILEEDPEVYAAMEHWVEAADWIVWQLTGDYVRNACTAGYKGIYQDGQLPLRGLPGRAQPRLRGLRRGQARAPHRPARRVRRAAQRARPPRWTGLPEGIAVAVGNVDAHVTAPAARAVEPGQMVAIMGTSTCHVMNGDRAARGARACAASSTAASSRASGATRPARAASATSSAGSSSTASRRSTTRRRPSAASTSTSTSPSSPPGRPIGEHGLVALDWHSGNRSVLVDHELSGLVVGQTLATRAEDTYRALLEATAFGTRTIVEAFVDAGVPVTELVVAGGLLKNPLLMQIYADVTNLPLSTIGSDAGPGARLGDPRRGRRRRVPRRARRRRGDGPLAPRRLPADPGQRRGVRRAVRRVHACCTTTSAAAPTR